MGTYSRNALLLDGGTLYGVSERQGKGTSQEDSGELEFAKWTFLAESQDTEETAVNSGADAPDADAGEKDANSTADAGKESAADGAMSPRAKAFASAVRELQVEEGVPLAMPPDILVARVLSLPAADADSIASMVRLKMEKFAPVADTELEVDYEVVGVTESETRVFAVAVPISTLDVLADDLGASGLAVTRIDSSLLCEWHSLSRRKGATLTEEGDGADGDAQTKADNGGVYVIELPSGRIDLIAADQNGPVFARTLGSGLEPEDLVREATLSLLDLSAERPSFPAGKFFLVSPDGADSRYAGVMETIAGAAPEFLRSDDLMPFVEAAMEREDEEGCIDIVPSTWRDDENAAIAKRRFIYGAIAAVAVWAIAFATLKLIPKAIERRTAAVRREIAAIMPRYGEVAELRTRVRLIQSYEDRSRSALETLRELCEAMPEDVTLATFGYEKNDENGSSGRRGGPGGIRITGDAASADSILRLKDALDEREMFDTARLKGPTMDGQRRRHKFELDWRFAEGEE